jgi:hypothetical protein
MISAMVSTYFTYASDEMPKYLPIWQVFALKVANLVSPIFISLCQNIISGSCAHS